jgi:glucose/arabinose dehydrogenase
MERKKRMTHRAAPRGVAGKAWLEVTELEARTTPAVPAAPVIIEPFTEGQITGTFDINMQTDPLQYADTDGHAWQATDWVIREAAGGTTVWQAPFKTSPPLTLYRVDFSDGTFVNSLAGRTELNYNTNYQLVVRYRDANNEVSASAVRGFRTASASQVVPGAGTWLVRPGYVVEPVQTGLRLPVNIAFVPNPGPNAADPLYYVNELYGSIRVVRRDGTMQTFATDLLDYNPQGPISGSGEQGLTGLAVERDSSNPAIYHLYVGVLWNNGSPPGAPNHYPKVERITSAAGGLTMASKTVLLNMQPETQGQSHIISNITIGPDNKLYVHMGDGFNSATALNLEQFRGKVLRMNKDGAPVATGDPAGANPFYSAANGITARDYVYTYGHRNPFGGAWRPADGKHWVVENGNSLDRMVDLTAGTSYGWAGNDSALSQFSKFVWNPSTAPVNIDFVDAARFGGSGFPASTYNHAFVSLSGSTYASGPQQRSKGIVEFTDLNTLGTDGKLVQQPTFFVKYNGTGRASVAGLAAGPDGLYFTDLYEDTGSGGATGAGANVYRVRFVGTTGGQVPTVATAASATPNPVNAGVTANLSVLGADDGGENDLSYTWGVQGNPPSAVSFSANGTNAAKNSVATFAANGTYELYVQIRDVGGQSAISNVTVVVNSVPTGAGNGLRGAYFNNIDFTGSSMIRIDPTVDFNWAAAAPTANFGADTFSVRWNGFVVPRYSETYTFSTTTDDGVRLWVNNQLIVDHYVDQGATTWTGTIALTAGVPYAIRMDYYENGGAASARLLWQSATQPLEVIPKGQMYGPTAVPFTPTNLTAVPFGGNRIDLAWSANDSLPNLADGYLVEQSPNGTSGWTQVASVTGTAHSVTGLTTATPYYFRVRAFNSVGNSPYSAIAGAVTGAQGPTINYPTNFANVPAGGSLTFVGGAAVVNNRLRLTSAAGNQARAAYATNAQNITAFSTSFTYTKTGAADGTTFVIHRDPRGLAALGPTGNGLAYGGINPSFALALNIYVPYGPGTAFATNGATPSGYTQAGGVNFSLDNTPVKVTITYLGGSTLDITLTQGANSQTKTYTFTSTLAALLGGNTATVGFTGSTGGANAVQEITDWVFTPLTVPAAPTGLQSQLAGYTAASTSAVAITNQLTWTAAAGAAGYRVERKLGAGGTFAEIGAVTVPTFGDSGLAPGSTYFYRVRGTNPVGAGPFSAEFSVTTPPVPATPTAGTVTGTTADSISLRWTDNANNEAGFQIFRTNGDDPLTLIASLPLKAAAAPSFVEYTDPGLTVGIEYRYEIRAFNLSGYNGAATAMATTARATTTSLTATPLATTGGSPVMFTATVSPSPGALGTVTFKDNGTTIPGGANIALSGGTAVFSTSSLAVGSHPITAEYSGFTGYSASTSAAQTVVIQNPVAAPQVVRVTPNANLPAFAGEQRSQVVNLVVEFDQPVDLDPSALTLGLHLNNVVWNGTLQPAGFGALPTSLALASANNNTVWTMTFSGNTDAGLDGIQSLKDGVYDLNIDAAKVHPAGVPGVTMAASQKVTFHRLFGDTNAPTTPTGGTPGADFEAIVNTGDNLIFRAAFNSDPNYKRYLDYEGDGFINTGDNLQFRGRFNRALTWRV